MLTLNAIYDDQITAATGTAVQEVAAIVNKHLCKSVCLNQTIQPTPSVTYSIASTETNGTTTFVRLKASGTIAYVPKGSCGCNTITQSFTEYTTLIFYNSAATSAPAVSLVQGLTDGYLVDINCMSAHGYEMATNVTVSAIYS